MARFFLSYILFILFLSGGSWTSTANAEVAALDGQSVMKKLDGASSAISNQIKKFWDRWQITEYPNFLNSAAITHTSWEVMKLKYEQKILRKFLGTSSEAENTFVVAFMGSSVTAGHDSPFNQSFVSMTQVFMAPSFSELGIAFEARNVAMGNNPCMPYDICPMTFSGDDADIVHWEQSYNCFGHETNRRDMFEQFIRQCMYMSRNPIVVFSESGTPNWREKDCPKRLRRSLKSSSSSTSISPGAIAHALAAEAQPDFAEGWNRVWNASQSSASHLSQGHGQRQRQRQLQDSSEKRLVTLAQKGDYLTIASEINYPAITRGEWAAQVKTFQAYQVRAGVQVWSHKHYEAYKCKGPYVPDWGCCSASWHPSLLGHELRAAHHSLFWLAILKEAVDNIKAQLANKRDLQTQLSAIEHHIQKEAKHVPGPGKPLYESFFSEQMKCLTTFSPRAWAEGDLRKYIVSSGDGKPEWKEDIFEDLTDKNIAVRAKANGYLDFKKMLHGNVDNSALSLAIVISTHLGGTFFLCEPPGNWGKLPGGFTTLWQGETKVYITLNVDASVTSQNKFVFDAQKAVLLPYTNRKPKDSQELCVDFAPYKIPAGAHVISIVPTSKDRVMVSTLVLPH